MLQTDRKRYNIMAETESQELIPAAIVKFMLLRRAYRQIFTRFHYADTAELVEGKLFTGRVSAEQRCCRSSSCNTVVWIEFAPLRNVWLVQAQLNPRHLAREYRDSMAATITRQGQDSYMSYFPASKQLNSRSIADVRMDVVTTPQGRRC